MESFANGDSIAGGQSSGGATRDQAWDITALSVTRFPWMHPHAVNWG
jgi:hypothetical protein